MSRLTSAWQGALAAEQQAVFGYSLLGPHLDATDQMAARADQAAHVGLRAATTNAMVAAALVPADPPADYPALYPVTSAATARALAIHLEDAAARAWRYLFAVAADPATTPLPGSVAPARLRATAQTALTASAIRGARWRIRAGSTPVSVPFPGL